MKECIFCRERDNDTIEEHHTVPRSINPKWEKTIFLCQKCHRKAHRYLIGDLVDIIKEMKNIYSQMETTFNSIGIINEIEKITDLHKKVTDILLSNIPVSKKSGKLKNISITEIADLCDMQLEKKHSGNFRYDCQKVGYVLKDLKIENKFVHGKKHVIYNDKTVNRLKRLQRIIVYNYQGE